VEIERKFLVGDIPDLSGYESVSIEQGYLALAVDGGAEVRLRRKDGERLLTVKGGTGEVRAEEEIELDAERFDSLWPLTEGRRLSKTRYLIPLGEHTAELDVYEGELESLVTAEVEFGSKAEADRFEPPPWFGPEATGDQRYLNESLATVGRPPGSPLPRSSF
jgi:CYTH domain-containing protein